MKHIKLDDMAIKAEKFDHLDTNIGDIIKDSIREQLVIFQDILNTLLKRKDEEAKERIKTIDDDCKKSIKNLEETYQEEFLKFEARNKRLETETKELKIENEKLQSENEKLQTENKKFQTENKKLEQKSKKKQPKCVECVENFNRVTDLEKQLSDSKISRTAEDIRMKRHIFKRQEKIKRYKQLLIEKDQEIMEKEESIVKYQEEIFAFEEKLKVNFDKDEDLVPAEEGTEKDEDLPTKDGEEKLVPIDELLSPLKDAEDNNSSALLGNKNHSSLLAMVENAAKYYKSSSSSEETGEPSEEKKNDSLELEEMV